jgi:hypothetical protein
LGFCFSGCHPRRGSAVWAFAFLVVIPEGDLLFTLFLIQSVLIPRRDYHVCEPKIYLPTTLRSYARKEHYYARLIGEFYENANNRDGWSDPAYGRFGESKRRTDASHAFISMGKSDARHVAARQHAARGTAKNADE